MVIEFHWYSSGSKLLLSRYLTILRIRLYDFANITCNRDTNKQSLLENFLILNEKRFF
jgi:hypothetical protein